MKSPKTVSEIFWKVLERFCYDHGIEQIYHNKRWANREKVFAEATIQIRELIEGCLPQKYDIPFEFRSPSEQEEITPKLGYNQAIDKTRQALKETLK